jgi:hypothetical protein
MSMPLGWAKLSTKLGSSAEKSSMPGRSQVQRLDENPSPACRRVPPNSCASASFSRLETTSVGSKLHPEAAVRVLGSAATVLRKPPCTSIPESMPKSVAKLRPGSRTVSLADSTFCVLFGLTAGCTCWLAGPTSLEPRGAAACGTPGATVSERGFRTAPRPPRSLLVHWALYS